MVGICICGGDGCTTCGAAFIVVVTIETVGADIGCDFGGADIVAEEATGGADIVAPLVVVGNAGPILSLSSSGRRPLIL